MLLVDLTIIKASIRPLNQSTRKPMLINPDKRTWTMSQSFDFTFICRMKLRLFILCTLTYQIRRNIKRDSISQNRLCTKNKILIKDFFSICNKIRGVMRIWSYLLMNSIMKIFGFVQCSIIKISVAQEYSPYVMRCSICYQFKKCEKHPWRSVTFSKLPGQRMQLYWK